MACKKNHYLFLENGFGAKLCLNGPQWVLTKIWGLAIFMSFNFTVLEYIMKSTQICEIR